MARPREATEAGRRRSASAVVAGLALVAMAVPALQTTYSLDDAAAEPRVTQAPTTSVDPAAVGLRRLDRSLQFDDEAFGAIGFTTGAIVVALTDTRLIVIDLDSDVVGALDEHPIEGEVQLFDAIDRSVVIVETPTGRFRIDARGRIELLALDAPPRDLPSGRVTPLCDDPCDHVLVSPLSGGSWTATFDAPIDPAAPVPSVSAGGDAVAAWVRANGESRLEVATADRTATVPFSNQANGDPAALRFAQEGDGLVYGWENEPRIVVFSPSKWASGTIWLDESVRYAAVLPAG